MYCYNYYNHKLRYASFSSSLVPHINDLKIKLWLHSPTRSQCVANSLANLSISKSLSKMSWLAKDSKIVVKVGHSLSNTLSSLSNSLPTPLCSLCLPSGRGSPSPPADRGPRVPSSCSPSAARHVCPSAGCGYPVAGAERRREKIVGKRKRMTRGRRVYMDGETILDFPPFR